MNNAFSVLGDVIGQLWYWMLNTNIPNTNITFGGLYLALLMVSIVCMVIGFIVRKKGE